MEVSKTLPLVFMATKYPRLDAKYMTAFPESACMSLKGTEV